MHSLCAACSWRQSLCSGKAPWYYIRFPREHTLIVGLLSVTEPEISPFSGGDSVSKAGRSILISHSYCQNPQKYVFSSLAPSLASWHFCQHETRSWNGLIERWKRPHSRRASVPQQFLCFAGGAGSKSNGQIGEQHHKVPARPETGNLAARQLPPQKTKKAALAVPSPVPCSAVGMSWYLQPVKMWHELSPANRNGCYGVVRCSLLRSNNKIRDKSISGKFGGTEPVSRIRMANVVKRPQS